MARAMNSIPLVLSQEHPCGYIDGESSQSLFIHPSFPLSLSIYNQLIAQGFRRSGNEVYAPHCPHCSACIPARLSIKDFKPNRRQKRCLKKISTHRLLSNPLFLNKPTTRCIYAINRPDILRGLWLMPTLTII